MPLKILPVRLEDVHTMVLFRIAALEQSPTIGNFWHQLHGKCERSTLISMQEKILRENVMGALSARNRKFLKVVDGETHDAEIISYCQWAGPVEEEWEIIQGAPKPSIAEQMPAEERGSEGSTLDFAEGENVEALAAIHAVEVDMNDRMWRRDKMRCFRFTNLVTNPKHQGRGAGSLLVRHGLAMADAAHLPVVLQADPDGYRIYRRHGFEDFDVWQVDLARYGGVGVFYNMGMIRPAR